MYIRIIRTRFANAFKRGEQGGSTNPIQNILITKSIFSLLFH